MAHVLITGGSGLLGWRAVEQLVEDGHEVVVYDLRPDHANLAHLADRITVVSGDVTDLPRLLRVMRSHRIERVVHLAALITEHALQDPPAAFRINTLGTANVFEAALATGVERVVWTSSVTALAVTDDYDNTPVGEDHPHISTHPYGASKFAAEVVADGFVRDRGLDVIGIRPALVYGLGRMGGGAGLFNEAARRLALEGATELLGSRTLHQPMYNRDAGRLLAASLFVDRPQHHIFNMPAARSYSDDEMATEVAEAFPDAEVKVAPAPDYIPRVPVVDGSRAVRELGFTPRYSLADGMRELAEHFRRTDLEASR